MKRLFSRRILVVCIVAACLLSIIGCRTKIGKIVANPDQFKNKQVVIVGEVVKKFPIPFFETAAYLLKDNSGEIWVLTKRANLPEVGQRLKVTGVVEAGIRVGPKEFGLVLSEQEQQAIKSK